MDAILTTGCVVLKGIETTSELQPLLGLDLKDTSKAIMAI